MDYFYLPDIDASASGCILPKVEAKHLVHVLRKQLGDRLLVTNGKGLLVEATISRIANKNCEILFNKITEHVDKRPYKLSMAIAFTKNLSRFEMLLEKITEIGIDHIIPLITFHSERRKANLDRLKKILISAMKQSQRSYLPQLSEPVSFKEFIKLPIEGKGYIAHCYKDMQRKSIGEHYIKGTASTILIGPEGDFSKEEIVQAEQVGYEGIHLGTSRLRTETAGIVACSSIYQLNF